MALQCWHPIDGLFVYMTANKWKWINRSMVFNCPPSSSLARDSCEHERLTRADELLRLARSIDYNETWRVVFSGYEHMVFRLVQKLPAWWNAKDSSGPLCVVFNDSESRNWLLFWISLEIVDVKSRFFKRSKVDFKHLVDFKHAYGVKSSQSLKIRNKFQIKPP